MESRDVPNSEQSSYTSTQYHLVSLNHIIPSQITSRNHISTQKPPETRGNPQSSTFSRELDVVGSPSFSTCGVKCADPGGGRDPGNTSSAQKSWKPGAQSPTLQEAEPGCFELWNHL